MATRKVFVTGSLWNAPGPSPLFDAFLTESWRSGMSCVHRRASRRKLRFVSSMWLPRRSSCRRSRASLRTHPSGLDPCWAPCVWLSRPPCPACTVISPCETLKRVKVRKLLNEWEVMKSLTSYGLLDQVVGHVWEPHLVLWHHFHFDPLVAIRVLVTHLDFAIYSNLNSKKEILGAK